MPTCIASFYGLRPASDTASVHIGISAAIMAVNSSGVFPSGSTPRTVRRAAISGSLTARATSAEKRSTIALEVPAGASGPFQTMALKPGKTGFADGRDVGRLRRTLQARDRQHADRPALGLLQRIAQQREHGRHVSGDDVAHGGRIASVTDRGHFQTGPREKHLHRQMDDAAGAALGVSELFRLRLHPGDELGHGLDRHVLIHDQHRTVGQGGADRNEVLHRVVGHFLQRRRNRDLRRCGPKERVAVRRCMRDRLGRERAAGADAVLDDELLLEHFAEPLGDDARRVVAGAAGRKGIDEPHRPLRPILRLCRSALAKKSGNQCGGKNPAIEHGGRSPSKTKPSQSITSPAMAGGVCGITRSAASWRHLARLDPAIPEDATHYGRAGHACAEPCVKRFTRRGDGGSRLARPRLGGEVDHHLAQLRRAGDALGERQPQRGVAER